MNVFLKNTKVCVLHHIALHSFLGIHNTAFFSRQLICSIWIFENKEATFHSQ